MGICEQAERDIYSDRRMDDALQRGRHPKHFRCLQQVLDPSPIPAHIPKLRGMGNQNAGGKRHWKGREISASITSCRHRLVTLRTTRILCPAPVPQGQTQTPKRRPKPHVRFYQPPLWQGCQHSQAPHCFPAAQKIAVKEKGCGRHAGWLPASNPNPLQLAVDVQSVSPRA